MAAIQNAADAARPAGHAADDRAYQVRPIDDSLDAYASIAAEGLLHPDRNSLLRNIERVGRENLRGVYCGDRLVGGMAFYRMGQWFGGRPLEAAGFSGVAIDPAERGSGACRQMLQTVIRELHAQRIPIASLYASTQRPYRAVDFEQAGVQMQYSLPLQSIGLSDRSLPVTRCTAPPLRALQHVAQQRAASTAGNLQRSEGLWQRLLQPTDGVTTSTYLIGDADAPEGYAIFRHGDRVHGIPQPLVATDLAAVTPAAARRLLTLVTDHRSLCDTLRWYGAPNDPLIALCGEQGVQIPWTMRWMTRILCFPEAWQGRGYRRSTDTTLHFDVSDPLLPENGGRWTVQIADAVATVQRGGAGHLRIDVRACAPLLTGFYSASQLLALGWLTSDQPAQIAAADAALAGPIPWMPELF